MYNTKRLRLATIPILALSSTTMALAQSSVAVSPFVSYVPSAAQNPLAGFALTFGGTTGLALRGGADMSISTPKTTNAADPSAPATGGYRPWSADADAMLFLGGLGGGATVFSRSLSPYLFSGIGLLGGDSAGVNVVHNGWSYGAGATIPLGLDADVFGEARWRMSQYVLPTAKGAPDSKSEMRFGLSFHVGGSAVSDDRRRRRHRMDDDYDDDPAPTPVVVVPQQPAPQPQTVVVTPAPQPTTVVVVPQAQPEPQPRVSVNFPIIIGSRRQHRDREIVVVERHDNPGRRIVERVQGIYRANSTTTTTTAACQQTSNKRRASRSAGAAVCVVPQ